MMENKNEQDTPIAAPQDDLTGIHVDCDDAYKGDVGEDTGSELALWKRADGGLNATIFLNDTSAKAYGLYSYNFSFNKDQLAQIVAYITTTNPNPLT